MKMLVSKLAAMTFALFCGYGAAAAGAQSSTDAWVKVAPAGEEFSVLLPRAPAVKDERKSLAGWRVSGRRYRVQEGDTLYTIWSFKPEIAPADAQQDKSVYLDLCAELAWDIIVRPEFEAARNRRESPLWSDAYALSYQRELPSPTHPGRNYLLGIGKLRGATQIYLGDGRIYLVAALSEPGQTSKPETFMRSFSVGGKSLANREEEAATAAARANAEGGVGPARAGGADDNSNSSNGRSNSDSVGDKVDGGSGMLVSAPPVDYDKPFTTRTVTKKANIRSKAEPLYTESARKFGVTGVVRLRLILSASGEVSKITPVKTLPHGLTQKAVEAAGRIKFDPAIKDGRKVSQYATIEYNFNIY
jgi:TonB family protein